MGAILAYVVDIHLLSKQCEAVKAIFTKFQINKNVNLITPSCELCSMPNFLAAQFWKATGKWRQVLVTIF